MRNHKPSANAKQALVAGAAVLGINTVDRKWIAAFSRLQGSFERGVFELAVYVMGIVTATAVTLMLGFAAVRKYLQFGWTDITTIFSIYAICMSVLLYILISRANLRYEFAGGTLSAYNTWGRLMWCENLTGLQYVTSFSARSNTSMTLMWPERKRTLLLFDSMRDAVNASLESAKKAEEERSAAKLKEDEAPAWICQNCHEENPANFEECWKCQKYRPTGTSE